MGTDPRIGRPFLNAGLGYGGSCFPKDLQAFQRLSERLGYKFPLLEEVARINKDSVRAVRNKIEDTLWNLEGKRVALLGLAFKPGTDDTRDAPALELARMLIEEGVTVVGYDPQAMTAAKTEIPELETAPDAYEAAAGTQCLVVCTEWDEFKSLDLVRIKNAMRYPVIVDGRNIFDPAEMNAHGFAYYPTGRKMVR
jgi:UDPglucose 6-dehydrogenase